MLFQCIGIAYHHEEVIGGEGKARDVDGGEEETEEKWKGAQWVP